MLTPNNNFIYHEMMAHPALFTHARPQKIAIIGDPECGILQEALKHSRIHNIWQIEKDQRDKALAEQHFSELNADNNPRVKFYFGDYAEWIEQTPANSFDVIIVSTQVTTDASRFLQDCFAALSAEGILVQQSNSPFEVNALKPIYKNLHAIGFRDVQVLHFPEPHFPSGWRMAFMATKRGVFRRASEKDIFNKSFTTRYYNFDIHRAALALPEFMREELEIREVV